MNNTIYTDKIEKLLNDYLPDFRKRVIHDDNLHNEDIKSLISEMNDNNISYEYLHHALDILSIHIEDIHKEHKEKTILQDTNVTESFKNSRMYQVGLARLVLDITLPNFRKRHSNITDSDTIFYDKWYHIYQTHN